MKKALKGMKISFLKLIPSKRQNSVVGPSGSPRHAFGVGVPKFLVPAPSSKLARRKQIALELQRMRSRAG